jgi:hypothetical protein
MEQATKTKLLTVEDTFLIEGRGLIVTNGEGCTVRLSLPHRLH